MNKHTPGPWHYESERDEVRTADGEPLLVNGIHLPTGYHPRHKEYTANARLIAAAPDLLDVAQAIYAFAIHEDYDLWSEREFTERLNTITEQACAAIAKATREQS